MHSVTLDGSGSPRKRTFSRGMSEDESLRSIIKETDSSSRRLSRSDSRAGGTLKRRSGSQFDPDLVMGLPEMLELQASYDEVVQELRGLEVEREALLFQVDVLQDTLEGVEELLAEAQREAGQASVKLEEEREAKKKLESMVCSLMQEVEKLKEERNNKPVGPHGREEEARAGHPGTNELTKQRKVVTKALGRVPSLALDGPAAEDGVLQRPYENRIGNGRDASPDRNDSDSISAYEDASAETPEQDNVFPGEDTLELPDDSESADKNPTDNSLVSESQTENPKNAEACVVS